MDVSEDACSCCRCTHRVGGGWNLIELYPALRISCQEEWNAPLQSQIPKHEAPLHKSGPFTFPADDISIRFRNRGRKRAIGSSNNRKHKGNEEELERTPLFLA